MTDSLKGAGYGSRVHAQRPASGAPADAGPAPAADGSASPTHAAAVGTRPPGEPGAIDRSVRGRTAAVPGADPDRPQRASGPAPRSAWTPSEASWKARTYVNLCIGAGVARPGSLQDVLGAAIREVQAANLPHVAEALVRKCERQDSKGPERVALAVVRGFANPRVPLDKSAQLVAGVLRALDREPTACQLIEFMAQEIVRLHSEQDRKAFGSGCFVDANGLIDGIKALVQGLGGPQVPSGRLQSLLGGLEQAIRPAGATASARAPVQPEDQALALGALCKALGGSGMAPAHRQAILAFLCQPSDEPAPSARAAMAYQFGVAIGLSKASTPVQCEVLAAAGAAPGLALADVGAMAWGFGMHLLGKDPEDARWQDLGDDIVTASGTPAEQLVQAVARRAAELPETCRQRLAAGLGLASQLQAAADKERSNPPEAVGTPVAGEAPEAPRKPVTPVAGDAPDRADRADAAAGAR